MESTLLQQIDKVQRLLPQEITLTRLLAQGGQGVVFGGLVGDRPAAIKIYFPGQVFRRIQREIDALGALECGSIVGLLWSGQIRTNGDELQAVATELVPGEVLEDMLARGPIGSDEAAAIAYDMATAISALWARRIVHRDIKPSNIIVEPTGRGRLIDLGIARHVDKSDLTAAGWAWGTAGFMSPEQYRGVKQLTCKSDIFSLGVVLCTALDGSHPTRGDQERLLLAQLHNSLPDARWQFAPMLRQMLDPSPTRRPAPTVILHALRAFSRPP